MRINIRDWFPAVWGRSASRVVAEYQQVGRLEHFLADIALRGHVYVDAPPARDLFEAGVNEGKRRMALGIINTANAPHDQLYAVIDSAQRANANASATRRAS